MKSRKNGGRSFFFFLVLPFFLSSFSFAKKLENRFVFLSLSLHLPLSLMKSGYEGRGGGSKIARVRRGLSQALEPEEETGLRLLLALAGLLLPPPLLEEALAGRLFGFAASAAAGFAAAGFFETAAASFFSPFAIVTVLPAEVLKEGSTPA